MTEAIKRYSSKKKQLIIDAINEKKGKIVNAVFTNSKIPEAIVNAPLSEIVAYKENCELISKDRFIKGDVHPKLTGKKLMELDAKFNGYCQLVMVA